MRKLSSLLVLITLWSIASLAQESKADVFGGYSYMHVSPGSGASGANTNGWEAQVTGNLTEILGATADFDGHYGDVFGVGGHDYNFLFGPTLFHRTDKITPFAHALFGVSYAGANGISDHAFAWAIGGGLDWNVKSSIAVRIGQFDYLATHFANTTQNNFRYSAGVVFRFGGH